MKKQLMFIIILISALGVSLVFVGCGQDIYYSPPGGNQGAAAQAVPRDSNLVNGIITVQGNNYYRQQFSVTSSMQNAAVSGSFRASGGSGNDIKVLIIDSTAFINWSNGHTVSTYYNSGQLTVSSFNIALPVGTYYLILDNTFSMISSKQVNTQVNLQWQEVQ